MLVSLLGNIGHNERQNLLISNLGTGVDHKLKVVSGKLLDESLGEAAGVDGIGGGVEGGLVAAVELCAEAGQVGAGAVALLQLVHQLSGSVLTAESHAICRAVFSDQPGRNHDFMSLTTSVPDPDPSRSVIFGYGGKIRILPFFNHTVGAKSIAHLRQN